MSDTETMAFPRIAISGNTLDQAEVNINRIQVVEADGGGCVILVERDAAVLMSFRLTADERRDFACLIADGWVPAPLSADQFETALADRAAGRAVRVGTVE